MAQSLDSRPAARAVLRIPTALMKQLALDLAAPPQRLFRNFVTGRNAEAQAAIERLACGAGADRCIYLWGGEGSGRSHLLQAAVAEAVRLGRPARYLDAAPHAVSIAAAADDVLLALDDAQQLDAEGQHALFGFYNRMLAGGGALLASGSAAPAKLGLRADLATRLAWGLVYEVHALSDQDKAAAMGAHAAALGFDLPADVASYLLRHARRDLPTLIALIESLDRRSLEERRAVSVALARDVLTHLPDRTEQR